MEEIREEAGSMTDLSGASDTPPPQHTAHISCLFPEILSMIFRFLDLRSKGRVARVSSVWKEAAYRHRVWRGVEAKLHIRKPKHSLLQSLVQRGIRRIQVLSLRRGIRDIIIGVPDMCSLSLSGCFNVTDAALSAALTHDLPRLTTLDVSLCKQITDASLARIAQHLINLEELDVGGCSNITSIGVQVVARSLKRLRALNLRSCRHITDQGIEYLAGTGPTPGLGTPELSHLTLQDCQKLTDLALKHASVGLRRLHTLNLSFCASVTDTGLRHLSRMPSLADLNLRSCDNVSDVGVGYLAETGTSRLSALDVSFCERVGDESLAHISTGITHLRTLSLCSCAITDAGVERLVCAAPELQALAIGQCTRVTDEGLALIADQLKNLESIDLYGCTRITTVGLERIMKLPRLTTLNLGLWHKSKDARGPGVGSTSPIGGAVGQGGDVCDRPAQKTVLYDSRGGAGMR